MTFGEPSRDDRVAFFDGLIGFAVGRRVGALVRTGVTVRRVVVVESSRGFLVVGREEESGTLWGCFVGAAIGCDCVRVAVVLTANDCEEDALVGVNFVVLLTDGRGRFVVTFGKLCVVGGLRCVVGFTVVTVGIVEASVVVVVDAASVLMLDGVSSVVTSSSSSCTD